jgi:N utilization substance protein B
VNDAPVGPGRHEARERAIELLYEADTRSAKPDEILESLPLDPDPYAAAAFTGVSEAQIRIDEVIEEFSTGWSVHRMPLVDRAILRLAVWELLDRPDVPTAVVLNEAVELAKDYSTERSPAFINGVLDTVAANVRD